MRVVVDTHILLWWLGDHPSLPPLARAAIADPEVEVLVSAASVWEVAIKQAAGRLLAPGDLLGELEANGFDSLPITSAHAQAAGKLPGHHSDVFDRMLIAQAQTEGLTIITVDRRFPKYEVDLLPLG